MKNRPFKIMVIAIMIIALSSPLLKVYASEPISDIIYLARSKVLSIAGMVSNEQYLSIENKAISTETGLLIYIDDYIKGLEKELRGYATSQGNIAQNNLDQEVNSIKEELENGKQTLIEEGKANIKNSIDNKYEEELNKLNQRLNEEVKDKFK